MSNILVKVYTEVGTSLESNHPDNNSGYKFLVKEQDKNTVVYSIQNINIAGASVYTEKGLKNKIILIDNENGVSVKLNDKKPIALDYAEIEDLYNILSLYFIKKGYKYEYYRIKEKKL